jgi:hypothetical protein
MQPVAESEVIMYQIPLINTVRAWEKRIQFEGQQKNYTNPWFHQPERNTPSAEVKPVAESEPLMHPTSLVSALQLWERRWQAEADQRNQRALVAETGHETIFRRLPRIKLGSAKQLNETAELCACCQSQADYEDAFHS